MKINTNPDSIPNETTHEGAVASHISAEQRLRRTVLACMLWEDIFYEDGESVADRIEQLVGEVHPEVAADLAIEARERFKLRHVPLQLVRVLARRERASKDPSLVRKTLARVVQRPDELAEFLALYWLGRKKGEPPKLSAQVKKGLAAAFGKFNEYSLAKYNRGEKIRLRDVLFLCHAKPVTANQTDLWKRLVANKLVTPDTWEVAISAAKSPTEKLDQWMRLLSERKLGALALLRNLRNLRQVGVSISDLEAALAECNVERVLPFRFITAATIVPELETSLERLMFKCLEGAEKLEGKSILIVDTSGSMDSILSSKSTMTRLDAAAGLAILARELCEDVAIYATAGNDVTRFHKTVRLPSRRGFALRDALQATARPGTHYLGGGGIFLRQCMDYVLDNEKQADRILVFTDEQDCDRKLNPDTAPAFGRTNYLFNVAAYRNGIGYGKWHHIDGFSEAVFDYVREFESSSQ